MANIRHAKVQTAFESIRGLLSRAWIEDDKDTMKSFVSFITTEAEKLEDEAGGQDMAHPEREMAFDAADKLRQAAVAIEFLADSMGV